MSVEAYRWLWFHGACFAKLSKGPMHSRYPARVSCACATLHGVVYHTDELLAA